MVNDLVILIGKSFEREEMEQEIWGKKNRMKSDTFFLKAALVYSQMIMGHPLCDRPWI